MPSVFKIQLVNYYLMKLGNCHQNGTRYYIIIMYAILLTHKLWLRKNRVLFRKGAPIYRTFGTLGLPSVVCVTELLQLKVREPNYRTTNNRGISR